MTDPNHPVLHPDDPRFTHEEAKALRELIRLQEDLGEIVHSKKVTQGVIHFIGEVAKYVAGLVAVILAVKNLWGKG